MRAILLGLSGLLTTGCLYEENQRIVGGNPFSTPPQPTIAAKANTNPADSATSTRVATVGRELLKQNREIGLNPTFATIGSSSPEIFHQGTTVVWISKGLVDLCKSDRDLAGVLSLELGKMVSERESVTAPETRSPEKLRPIVVPIGNDGGFRGAGDYTNLAELGRYEKANPRNVRLPRPDPQRLARRYMEKAGYSSSDFDAVQPLLEEADRHCALERQFKGITPTGN